MARRRYLSTEISTDTAVCKLAKEYGEFAALLYTWMIPHAEDDGSIHADAEKLILMVIPGFRWKTEQDVEEALGGMHQLGLVFWDRENETIYFPSSSFYRYQSYITESRRGTLARKEAQKTGDNKAPDACADNSAKQRKAAQSAEDQREEAQNAALFSFSVSSSVSSSVSNSTSAISPDEPGETTADAADTQDISDPPSPPKPTEPPGSDEPAKISVLPSSTGPPANALLHGFIASWNSTLVELGFPAVRSSTPRRIRSFAGRVSEAQERASPAFWDGVISLIASSDWLCESAKSGAAWLRFDWFLNESNLVKLLEGQYNRSERRRSSYDRAAEKDPGQILQDFLGGQDEIPVLSLRDDEDFIRAEEENSNASM